MFGHLIRRNKIMIEGERNAAFGMMRGRLSLLGGIFILAYIIMAVRVFDLTIIQGQLSPDHRTKSAQNFVLEPQIQEPVFAQDKKRRGHILDRNGTLLATNIKTRSLFADTKHISDPKATAKALSQNITGIDYDITLKKLQSGRRFVWLKRNILPNEQNAVLQIGEPGLSFQEEDQRLYPHGPLAAHVLGYTNVDLDGLAGLERSFNETLKNGENVNLSLDIRLQHALRREIQKTIKDFDAKAGAGVIMDIHSGEILAGVSLPDFNPNKPDFDKKYNLFNRLTLGVYELGSVFKIFSTAALLEFKDVPLSTKFDAREPLVFGRFKINDFHAQKRILTVPEVFMYSSNIGSGMMGQAVGTDALQGFYDDLGLLRPLDFELKEISKPLIPKPWGEINTVTASYGHGIATTPVQLAAAVATISNGGYLIQPTLLQSSKDTQEAQNQKHVQVISNETSAKMRQMMRLVVSDGTAKKADVPGFLVGGKTGTAEKSSKGGYDRAKLISSFVGIFPADNPKYLVFTMIDEPIGNKKSFGYATAGWTAAPTNARIVNAMASILGLTPRAPKTYIDPADGIKHHVTFKKAGR